MSAEAQITQPVISGTVGYERKVIVPSDPEVYGTEHAVISVYLPFEVDLNDASFTEESMGKAFAQAKEEVLNQLGKSYEIQADGIVSEIVAEFGAGTQVQRQSSSGSAPRTSGGGRSSGGGGGRRSGGGSNDVTVGRFTVCRVLKDEPLPDWLESELEALVDKGELPAEGCELWDNRRYLPRFGGDGNARSPWFKQKNGDTAVWPPKD